MRKCVGLAIVAVLGLAGWTQATPVDVKQVSADTKWAAHLDVDALMASKTMKKVREQVLKDHPDAETGLAMIRTVWRFDPTTDLHGITVYGTQYKKDSGVAIVRAKVDQKFLTDLVKLTPHYKTEKYGKHEVHQWLKDGKHHNAVLYQPDVIVFSTSFDELKAALDVLDGTKPNIETKHKISLPAGTILAAGAHDMAEGDLHAESPLAKQADSAWLLVGETNGQLAVHGSVAVKRSDVAKQIKAVADGIVAFASLATIDDADMQKLLATSIKLTQDDKTVSINAEAPVDQVWEQLQKFHAKHKAEMEKHGRALHAHRPF